MYRTFMYVYILVYTIFYSNLGQFWNHRMNVGIMNIGMYVCIECLCKKILCLFHTFLYIHFYVHIHILNMKENHFTFNRFKSNKLLLQVT
jgi:hypothetical protein